jgi:lipoprotein-anchoring transpeptidase ErfK/SrfK
MMMARPGKETTAAGRNFEVSNMKRERMLGRRLAVLTVAGLGAWAATAAIDPADARSSRDKRDEVSQSRAGAPLLAVVALGEQRVTIYSADGRMLQSPVSSGATGLETPAGIYSVVQKKEVHQSNVYEDGNMPFMQRITWTGIALHAGVLPGQPASHGCVRMPHAFAQRLFPLTDIGLRVVVVRDDVVPAEISHPVLFKPSSMRREAFATPPGRLSDQSSIRLSAAAPESEPPLASPRYLEFLKSRAAAKSAEADAATRRASEAKQLAARRAAEAGPATKQARAVEANLAKAEEQLKAAERALETATAAVAAIPAAVTSAPDATQQEEAARQQAEASRQKADAGRQQAEAAKAKAATKVAETQTLLDAAKAQAQAKAEAAARAEEAAKAAETARELAVDAAGEASLRTSPVSVFISRKTQRLYIRQGYKPVYETPIAIRDADQPIGSYVFTALEYLNNGADVRWTVLSMYKTGGKDAEPATPGQQRRKGEARSGEGAPADIAGAKAALDRVTIPPEALERISDVVLPGSSLIISDEGLSLETGKDTDFVVLMSGEPQGGIKTRRREQPRYRDDDFFWGGGGGGGRGGGGSFFSFFN